MTTIPLPPGLRFLDDTAFAALAAPFVEHGVLELVDVHAVDLIAGAFGFAEAEFFKVDDAAEREVPKVSFS